MDKANHSCLTMTSVGDPVTSSVSVSVSLKISDKPVKTITGLDSPRGVAVTNGLVVVSECRGHRITILDGEGKKIRSFGSEGKMRGQLSFPQGVAITSKGTILVVDCYNNRIQEYTVEGNCISCVGTQGKGPLQFSYPCGITINKTTGQVFVADRDNHRVQVLNSDLSFSHMFGKKGSRQGKFNFPHDVAINSKGFVYVSDCDNNRVQKFTNEGQFAMLFKIKGSSRAPSGITIDNNDLLYVNINTKVVAIYTINGEYVGSINKSFASVGWYLLHGTTCDNNTGYLYVCCCSKDVIEVFQKNY